MTHFADHSKDFSHGSINRLLRRDKLTGHIIWEHVKGDVVQSPNGCLVFDVGLTQNWLKPRPSPYRNVRCVPLFA